MTKVAVLDCGAVSSSSAALRPTISFALSKAPVDACLIPSRVGRDMASVWSAILEHMTLKAVAAAFQIQRKCMYFTENDPFDPECVLLRRESTCTQCL